MCVELKNIVSVRPADPNFIFDIARSFFEQIDLYRKQRASFKETWSNSPFLSLSQRYHPTVVSHPPPTPAESIFLISYGGNDYAFPILATPPGKLPSRNRIPKAAVVVEAMETNLRILIKEGATKIVLTTLLPPTISPQMRNNGRVLKIWSQKLFVEHNERLRNMTEKLMAENNKLKIVIFDLYSIMLDIAAEPDKHGLEEVISPCVEFDPTTKLFRRVCENQGWNSKRRLYWDHIHPTTDAHAILSTFLEPLIRETFLETPESQFGHLDFDEVLKYPLQPFGSPPRRLKESPQTPRHIGPYQTSAALPHFASRKYGLRAKRPTQIRSTPPAHSSAKRGVGGSVRFSG